MKNFLCRFECNMGETELPFFIIDTGKNKSEVVKKNVVKHDGIGLDTENSPIGGAEGQYCTDLYDVYEITPAQKKFLNKIGIH